jgi:uncharacterized membrane protein required for colicin V production
MTLTYLIIFAILIFCLLRGLQVGLIRSACGVLAVVAAGLLASQGAALLSPAVADLVAEPLSGLVEQQMTDALADAFGGEAALDALDGSDLFGSVEISTVLRTMGLYDDVANAVDSAVSSTLSTVIPPVANALAQQIADRLAYGLVYLGLFLVVLALGQILGGVLNLADHLPGLHTLNRLGGAVFGLVKGAAILLTLWWLMQKLGVISELGQEILAMVPLLPLS